MTMAVAIAMEWQSHWSGTGNESFPIKKGPKKRGASARARITAGWSDSESSVAQLISIHVCVCCFFGTYWVEGLTRRGLAGC